MSRNLRPSFGDSRWSSATVIAGLRIDEWAEPGQVIVEAAGNVDDETAPELLSRLTRAIFRESRVCCDLSAVGSFGATGADVLAIAHLTAALARGSFSVRGVHGSAAQVLETTGLDQILTVVP
jgi:anti-anti-sigma factor